jgi:hypothetical protein
MGDELTIPTTADVLAGRSKWGANVADAVAWLGALPDDSVDLLITSPPYELARTYGIGERMVGGQVWVDWMVAVVKAAAPKVKGVIAINCEGQTRGYRYSGVPFLLFADLLRAGFNLRKPPIFRRVGIPGSGGPDWLRNDYEPVICVTRPGKLPWSDNTACGHPPKWAPGGEMAHRLTDGTRVNQWGKTGTEAGVNGKCHRRRDGDRQKAKRPSHQMTEVGRATRGSKDGDAVNGDSYVPPALANPGNVLQQKYTAEEVADMLGQPTDVIDCNVGGGQMGHGMAHENEAPFPVELPDFFVRSFCPPGGVVADCFVGSGTVIHAAVEAGRLGIGCDVRGSQVELTARRLRSGISPDLFAAS